MKEVTLYIKKNPQKELFDSYKKQCLEDYASYIGYCQKLVLHKGEQGKPYIQDHPFHFNISHSYDYYIIACFCSPIGIDIEKHRPRKYKSLAQRFYTQDEQEYVDLYKEQGFYDIWCIKESYTKYLGESIFFNLSHINTCQDHQLKKQYQNCYLTMVDIDPQYSCSITTNQIIKIREVTIR